MFGDDVYVLLHRPSSFVKVHKFNRNSGASEHLSNHSVVFNGLHGLLQKSSVDAFVLLHPSKRPSSTLPGTRSFFVLGGGIFMYGVRGGLIVFVGVGSSGVG